MDGMRLSRRSILRTLLYAPLAALGLRSNPPSAAQSRPMITVTVCCAICGHYEPLQAFGFMIDGPPSGYCRNPAYSDGQYPCDEVIDRFQLHRRPEDGCGRFSIRKDIDPAANDVSNPILKKDFLSQGFCNYQLQKEDSRR